MWRPVLRGDWPAKLLIVSQICVGFVALLGVWSMITRRPILMLGFAFAQGILLVGIVLFVVAAATAQRAMNRFSIVVPITIASIFLLLFSSFNSVKQAALIEFEEGGCAAGQLSQQCLLARRLYRGQNGVWTG